MAKSIQFSALVEYFRKLASEHVDILHSEIEKHFYRFEIEELLSGIDNLNYPALIMEGYKFSFEDHKSDNPVKKKTGAFVLIDYIPDRGDYDRIHDVWDKMEVISDDILARIKADKRNPLSPVRDFDLESVEGQLVATEFGNHYGLRVTYSLQCSHSLEMNPAKWIIP